MRTQSVLELFVFWLIVLVLELPNPSLGGNLASFLAGNLASFLVQASSWGVQALGYVLPVVLQGVLSVGARLLYANPR